MTVHRTRPPVRAMRENPDIDQLKRQSRELLEAYRAQSPDAVTEVAAHHRTATPETFALHDAQFVLARSYGADPIEADAESWAAPLAWAERRRNIRSSYRSCGNMEPTDSLRSSE